VRERSFIIIASVLAVLLLAGGGIYLYDHSRRDLIAKGITVGGIDVGGQHASKARQTVERQLAARSNEPILVRRGGTTFRLTQRQTHVGFDVRSMVDDAVARSRRGSVFTRTWRGIQGSSIHADIPVKLSYSSRAVDRFVKRVAKALDRPPRNADLSFSGSGIDQVPGRDGVKLNRGALRISVRAQLDAQTFPVIRPRVATVHPAVTTKDLARKYPTVITIDRGGFALHLFKDLRPSKTYPIAVGAVGYDTPSGLYSITDKTVDPAWYVPNEAWAGDRAGTVVPGGSPDNPLKARWLGFFAGRGIHGTADDASVGSAASHGCIRMHVSDVEQLYDLTPVGTPVYVA
jgi:lipoprotein-anchoring transpeptidase ErfK/SrfK